MGVKISRFMVSEISFFFVLKFFFSRIYNSRGGNRAVSDAVFYALSIKDKLIGREQRLCNERADFSKMNDF